MKLGFSLFFVCVLISAIVPTAVQAQTVLITPQESTLPEAPTTTTRAIMRGPGIKLLTPSEVSARSFAFKIALEPRGGAKLDPASLRVEYMKLPMIDLTQRIKGGLNGNLIELAGVSVPPGTHTLRVSVKDSEGREASQFVSLDAR